MVELIKVIILGIIQGLTEFLPVSSSGHLAVFAKLLAIDQPGVLLDTVLHAGTALAVIWFLRERLMKLTVKDIKLIIIGTIPAGVIGVLFQSQVEGLFSILKLVGFAFLISAYINRQTDKQTGSREHLDFIDAIYIGIFQAFAIIPGITRSGSTIFAGSKMKLTKRAAAEFSFLLSIPAILGANAVELLKHGGFSGLSMVDATFGFVASFIAGVLAINFLMRMLTEKHLTYFSYYLAIVGVLVILLL